MKGRKKYLLATLFFVYLFGLPFVSSFGFSTAPTYTDPRSDSAPSNTDILYAWIDHNTTHLMFKVELAAPYNLSLTWQLVEVGISIDDDPGTHGLYDFKIEYELGVWITDKPEIIFIFFDIEDSSNSLGNALHSGNGYYILSNNNKTVEFGYKLQNAVYANNSGYLNVSQGQTIDVKFYAGPDTDYAPDWGLDPISYTLVKPDFGWIIILVILFPVVGVALGLFIYYRRRDVL